MDWHSEKGSPRRCVFVWVCRCCRELPSHVSVHRRCGHRLYTPISLNFRAAQRLLCRVPFWITFSSSGSLTPHKIFILSHATFIAFVFPKLKSFVTRSWQENVSRTNSNLSNTKKRFYLKIQHANISCFKKSSQIGPFNGSIDINKVPNSWPPGSRGGGGGGGGRGKDTCLPLRQVGDFTTRLEKWKAKGEESPFHFPVCRRSWPPKVWLKNAGKLWRGLRSCWIRPRGKSRLASGLGLGATWDLGNPEEGSSPSSVPHNQSSWELQTGDH